MSNIQSGTTYHLSPLVRRITASNGSVMTGPGTNTYLLGSNEVVVIDPGPADEQHIDRIQEEIEASGGRLHSIWVTHTHRDHSPGARILKHRTQAPCYGSVIPDDGFQDQTFAVDIDLYDGLQLDLEEFSIKAIHTPGHVHNHYCFWLSNEQMIFVGDHLMQGTTVVIIPPHGVMNDYIESLRKIDGLPLMQIAPGHGHIIENAHEVIHDTIRHRLARERLLLIKMDGDWQMRKDLVGKVYMGLDPRLLPFAEKSLHAHLIKLEKEGRVESDGETMWRKIHKESK